MSRWRRSRILTTNAMKALLLLTTAIAFGVFTAHAADAASRKADREVLSRLIYTPVPALTMREVPIERAIARYLELVATEWNSPKPLPYRIERAKRQPQQPAPPAEPLGRVTFGFSEDGFVSRLRELLSLGGLSSFTVRDGVIIFSTTRDLYDDEIWKQPILKPK